MKWLSRALPPHLCFRSSSAATVARLGILFSVDSTGDGDNVGSGAVCDDGTGHCTLRAAIQASNLNPTLDGIVINLPAGSVINLPRALPDVSDSVSISGPGADKLTVRRAAGGEYRIFNVTTTGTVAFSGLTISNGVSFMGAGINNNSTGTVNVTNCVLTGNIGNIGPGITNNSFGTVNVTNTTISGNMGGDEGGGIANLSTGTVNVTTSTIDDNHTGSNRIAGGIFNSGIMTVMGSTVSRNSAGDGGGICNSGGTVDITNSTISGNEAIYPNTGGGGGGGILNRLSGTVNITNSTISGNSATGVGGGIHTDSGTVRVKSSMFALNTGSTPDVSGLFTSGGFNLVGRRDGSAGFAQATDQTGTVALPLDPKLDPNGLHNNGGPTQTIALLLHSPAIDKGTSNGLTGQLTTDQRGAGFPRTFNDPAIANAVGGDGTDIGAFEERSTRGDFNGDSFTDYLLFNSSTRKTAIWNLQGNAFLNGVYGPTLPAGYTVACVADVNRDSKPDYVLFNASTRRTAIWFLNNATFLSSAFGPTLPAGWSLIAAVDINHDAHPDYVLFNASTRQTAVWFLNNTTFIGGAFGPTLPAGWVLIDAIDFDANGNPDFLLAQPSTGQTAIWYLSLTRILGLFGPTLPSGWMLKGSADFNSDGQPDYLLFEPSTRRTAQWYLNSANLRIGSAYSPTLPSGYTLVSP